MKNECNCGRSRTCRLEMGWRRRGREGRRKERGLDFDTGVFANKARRVNTVI